MTKLLGREKGGIAIIDFAATREGNSVARKPHFSHTRRAQPIAPACCSCSRHALTGLALPLW